MNICGIYKITNKINGKCYIGQSIHIQQRFYRHKLKATQDDGIENKPLYLAIKKYGLENFTFDIIEEISCHDLNTREQYWINHYKSFDKNFGYNISLGPQFGHLQVITEEIVNSIHYDLANTMLTNLEIGNKYNLSEFYISKINNGRHLRRENITYPIRVNKKEIHYCSSCGIELSHKGSMCQSCYSKSLRKVERPEPKVLADEIINTSFRAVGKKYGVTDNAIRKWCIAYNMPKTKKELIEWVGKFG